MLYPLSYEGVRPRRLRAQRTAQLPRDAGRGAARRGVQRLRVAFPADPRSGVGQLDNAWSMIASRVSLLNPALAWTAIPCSTVMRNAASAAGLADFGRSPVA